MDNREIVHAIRTAAALLELHGESEFKIRSYQNAIFNLEKYPGDLSTATKSQIAGIKGIGKSIAEDIDEMQKTGTFQLLQDLLNETPTGILELLGIKGLGAKKVRQLWKELGIENKNQLLEAIENDKLINLKGFGKKTQDKIKDALVYEETSKGKLLYSQAEEFVSELNALIEKEIPLAKLTVTGQVRRKAELIDEIQFLAIDDHRKELIDFINEIDILEELSHSSPYNWRSKTKTNEICITITFCKEKDLQSLLFITTGTPEHLSLKVNKTSLRKLAEEQHYTDEKEIYSAAGLPFYIPELREGLSEFNLDQNDLQKIITTRAIKGILHNHTTYSDGKNTILEMAQYCKEMGCEYLGINDHSKSAYYYANGMYEEQVRLQHIEIDKLNEKLKPFKIFKGIEVDILQDGSLDYDLDTLQSFDFTVASIHSGLKMDKIKATERIIKAACHPLTTMLGHLTGRLFLRRDGYPVDHEAIIDVCAKNNVIIELNANPRRLDMDWRWIRKAIDKGVMISINPDAHVKEGLHDIYYGVCVARKAALPTDKTFNAKSASEVDEFFRKRKEKALLEIK